MRASRFSLAFLVAIGGCYPKVGTDGEESPFPEPAAVSLDETVNSEQPSIVMRLTNAASIDPEVYAGLNRIANEQLDLADLFMKGGLPKNDDGTEIVPAVADAAGTSPEQLAFTAASGLVNAEEAVDACGNPQVGAFVTPRMLQHAGIGTDADIWPAACPDADCDTLTWGTVEVVPSAVRFDGMMDMVVNVHPNAITGEPAVWGHLLGWFLTTNNPGFTEAPLLISAKRAQLLLFNLWQDQKTYEHPGVGSRQVLAIPHTSRTVERAADIVVTLGPQTPEECKARWEADGGGLAPFGCDQGLPVLVDRTAPAGEELYTTFLAEGADPRAVETIRQVLEYQLQAAVACPGAALDDTAWVKDGPVELFVCPDGDLDTCMAAEDMEEYACRPVEETLGLVVPENQLTPVTMVEQREPYVLRSYLGGGCDFDPLDPFAQAGDECTGALPFQGTFVELEVTVDEDTVLYLSQPERVTAISGPGGTVDFPPPVVNSHCAEEPPFRYDVGGVWSPGTYTLEVPWTDLDDDLFVHVTSVPTWVF